ncbi:MAG: OadG-related small transporter subunit [Acetivibrionales bacterium]|jgi:Na+-transporting methylmalonyl-CoA/oxaloacetate decarboxylase gamma subunit
MLENFVNGTTFQKGIFVMIFGIIGVFIVLILFFLMIKVITRLFPYKDNEQN